MDFLGCQKTLKNELLYSGISLHGGKNVSIRCLPSEENSGVVFKRIDLKGSPEIRAVPHNIVSTKRCTSVGTGDGKVVVHVIEHLLAAFSIAGIDNVLVEIDGDEIPAGDGSAAPFISLIHYAGIKELKEKRPVIKIHNPIFVRDNDAFLIALPFDGFRISYTLAYENTYIGTQYGDYEFDEEIFTKEIAPARTFGFLSEVEKLREQGLALGGSIENAVLVDKNGTINQLRFKDEFVRHKILDMVGDLSVNGRLLGHFIGVKSGHHLNSKLSKTISCKY